MPKPFIGGTDESIDDSKIKALPGDYRLKQMDLLFSEITLKTFKITSKTLWRRG